MVEDSQNACQIAATQTQQQYGWRTPTSKEHKIPMKCPKTPRKAKSSSVLLSASSVIANRKRKMFFDVYNDEVELLFPPALLADLINKITTTT